jgi:hypothetical protein
MRARCITTEGKQYLNSLKSDDVLTRADEMVFYFIIIHTLVWWRYVYKYHFPCYSQSWGLIRVRGMTGSNYTLKYPPGLLKMRNTQ